MIPSIGPLAVIDKALELLDGEGLGRQFKYQHGPHSPGALLGLAASRIGAHISVVGANDAPLILEFAIIAARLGFASSPSYQFTVADSRLVLEALREHFEDKLLREIAS